MRSSLIILAMFIIGVGLGIYGGQAWAAIGESGSMWVLYLLMFLVGISVGSHKPTIDQLRNVSPKILLVPAATIFGTLAGVAALSWIISVPLKEQLMVGSGFGYYSLSSILITGSHGAELGTVALMSNVMRELITLVFAPLLVRWFSPLATICSGGATTMDTTLPTIVRFSGKNFIFVAIINGIVVDFSVPIFATLFSIL